MGPAVKNFKRQMDLCDRELPKLAGSSVEEYFADIADAAKEIVGEGELQAYEMYGVVASGFKAEDGDITITIQFPTPYPAGAKVCVALGLDNGETVDWTAIAGEATDDGSVKFVVDNDTILAIQNGLAMIAVISLPVEG